MIIPIPEWSPDATALASGLNGSAAAGMQNVISTQAGYRAIREWTEVTLTAVDDATDISGAFSAKDGFRTVDYAGDTAKLYAYDSVAYGVNDVSNGTYTTQTGDFWDFAQYGTKVIAVNGGASASDVPQILDTTAAVATAAADLGGSPPNAATIGILRDFVVVGHTYDATDGEMVGRVRWSGFGNETAWTPSAATQSDLQDLVSDVGAVQRILGGEDAFVVCQNGVEIMRYVGPPVVMRFDLSYPNIGTVYPQSCVRVGPHLYMYSKAGFVRLSTDGAPPAWIGAGRVNDSFFKAVLGAGGGTISDRLQVRGIHDPFNQTIWWTYGTGGAAYGYSYAFDRWYPMAIGSSWGLYTSDIGNSVTSARLPTVYGFLASSDRLYGLVGSDAQNYEVSTGYFQPSKGRRSLVRRVRPLVEHETSPGTMKLNTSTYDSPAETPAFLAPNQSNININPSTGHFDVLTEGRYINLNLSVSGATGEQHIYGLEVESASATGKF